MPVYGGGQPASSLTISGTAAAATVGDSTAFAPVVAGGVPPYRLDLLSGTLPRGRAVSGRALAVNGKYEQAGDCRYVLRATDATGATADLVVTENVAAPAGLALSGNLAFATGDVAGTVVATIANVPAGVTPSLSPNDGRLVIAGDAASGWKVVVGLTAASGGKIALAVDAFGLTGAKGDVIVTASGGVTPTPGGYDPTRPMGDTNRYTHPYSMQNLGAAGAAYLQVNNFYEGVAGWDEWGKLYAFPTIASANGGTESSITGTLTIRYMRGYGPTSDSYAPENVWTVGTIKGQTEYVASAADYPAVLADPMFTKSNPIPAGMHKFLRVWVISSNGSIPAATGIRAGTLEGSDSTPAANATSNYWNTTVWANRGRVNLNGGSAYGPCASFSRGPAGRIVFLEIGDSKLYADAGTNFNSFENGVRGWFRRSLNTLPAGQRRFALSLSVPGANPGAYVRNPDLTRGETPAKFAGKIASMKMLPEPPFTHIFNQHALNAGFGNLNTLFSDNMLEYFLKIRSFFPGIPIHAATVPACFNGLNCTDGYETQAGMPANPAFYPGGTFYEYNEALKSGKFAGLVDKFVDIAAAFNGSPNDPINPDPYKPRVYSGPISDTVLVDSTNNNKIRLSNPAQWDRGMSVMIDPLGLAKTGTPVGVINSFSGDDFSLQYSSGGSAGALAGMKVQPRYLVDKLHNTKEGDDLQIPTTVTYALTVTA